jgi:hypothetical protein
MNKTAFDIGFADGVKIAASGNPAAPVKGHNFGQPRVDVSAGAYLNTSGGRSAPTQTPGPVAHAPAPGASFHAPAPAQGGHLGVASSPDGGEKGKSDTGTMAVTKNAGWLSEMFGDDSNP